MTAHNNVEMITAKINNMDLVVLYKLDGEEWWQTDSDPNALPCDNDLEYFLCLPQHNENGQCLHWLNGGECSVSYESVRGVSGVITKNNTEKEWTPNSLFMSHNATIKIKPKKDKRWIAYSNERLGVLAFNTEQEVKDHYENETNEGVQFIEIEIEV